MMSVPEIINTTISKKDFRFLPLFGKEGQGEIL
jgi:hypothetical protein